MPSIMFLGEFVVFFNLIENLFFTVSSKKLKWNIFSLIILLCFMGCSPRPSKTPWPDHFQPPQGKNKITDKSLLPALWFTSTNFASGGYLGRMDLISGVIQQKIRTVGTDTVVLPDVSTQGVFLLNRLKQDGVGFIPNKEGQIQNYFTLPEGSNPQMAIRDSQGRVWLTMLDSNEVFLLSKDLKEKLNGIDLSVLSNQKLQTLKNSLQLANSYADLGPMLLWNEDTLWVGAQRLNRELGGWPPSPISGIAEININTLKINKTRDLELSNPILFGKVSSKGVGDPTFVLVGRGDFTQLDKIPGGYLTGTEFGVTSLSQSVKSAVTAADINPQVTKPIIVVWYPAENKSCVQIGLVPVLCDGNEKNGGYVFYAIRSQGNLIFVSHVDQGVSEIWMLTLNSNIIEGNENSKLDFDPLLEVQKISIALPVFSFSFGP